MIRIRTALCAGLVCASLPSFGLTVFDFEDQALGSTSFLTSTKDGITMDVTQGGESFDIQDLTFAGRPLTWKTHTLLPNTGGRKPMVANFSQSLSAVEIQSGDYFDDDDLIYLEGYAGLDGTGGMVASTTFNWPASYGLPNYAGLTIYAPSGQSIRSIKFGGIGLGGNQNIYFDNIAVEAVPEPAGLVALTIGALALIRRRK